MSGMGTEARDASGTGRRTRRPGLIALAALVFAIGMATLAGGAGAVHDLGLFELDGDTANGAATGEDWADVNGGTTAALSSSIIADGSGGASIFDGGGSKDISQLSDWKWKDANNVSQKTDLLHAGAALYAAQNGDPVLYLFADRDATNGDAKVGFWLFRSGVSANADGTFDGTHSDGDLLIESDFTQGGSNITNINVYRWQGGALTGPVSTGVDCGSAPGNDTECGINNHGTYSPPWGTSGDTTPGAFFEAGVNLATLFGGQNNVPCFSTVLAESRSAGSSVNSILEDFVLGSFSTCGTIEIVKQAEPATGTVFSYSTTGGSPLGGGFTLNPPSSTTKTFTDVKKGNYSVTEGGPPAGWTLTGLTCQTTGTGTSATPSGATANIALGYGGHVTCTYVNKRRPMLIVKKVVVNDNGGTKVASDFSFQVNGGAAQAFEADGQNDLTVDPGTYNVTEPAVAGYTTTYDGCSNVTLALGETKTCTVTNNDQPATLVVKKVVVNDNGGTKVPSDFSFQVNGGAAQAFEADGQNDLSLSAGTYNVTEPAVAGYTTTYSGCSNIVLALGETKTCTVTNNDQRATLHVKKVVVNDNGGTKVASDFSYTLNGDTRSFEADGQNDVTLNAGTYNVTEPPVAGYATTYDGCANIVLPPGGEATCTVTNNDVAPKLVVIKHVVNDNGGTAVAGDFSMTVDDPGTNPPSFPGAEAPGTEVTVDAGAYSVSEAGPTGYAATMSADCSGTLAVGQTKTCTVTNNDVAPKLVVIKHVVNDNGGTAVAGNFTMTVDDPGSNPPSFPGAEAPGTEVTVDAGAYSVSEAGPTGYAATMSADCSGTLAVGQTKTCTVTNNDIAPKLVVIKHVVNDNGGTAVAGNFTMTVDDPGTNPPSFPGAEAPGTEVTVDAGVYSVSEAGPSGYVASLSADCAGTLAVGQTKTCTVTNDDVAAKLVVIKHVVNDNGGTAVAGNFTMTVDDPGTNPPSFPGAEAPGTDVAVDPGAYSVSESGPTGYAATMSAECAGTIAIGETKTCTVTNNDVQPSLVVIKHVINDEGGTAVAGNFTMNVTGPSATPGSFPGAEAPGTPVALNAGAYTVTESGPSGYVATLSPDCSGSIAVGQTKTCTITNNDDIAPEVEVVKTANPTSVPETAPGATQNVVFTYTIYNRSAEPLKLTQFVDDKFDLGTKCPGIVGLTLAKDDGNDASGLDQVTCNFAVGLSGNAGATHTNVVNVTGEDDEGDEATDSDDAVVTFANTPSAITVIKTASPTSMQEPGGTVTFTVSVRNDSAVDTVTITSLVDSIHGNLNGQGTCSVPQTILPGATYTCSFTANVSKTETDVVTASGTDDDGNPVTDDDDATVTITSTPPPPPSTPETMDVAIVKDATAQVTLGSDGTAVIDYEARVRNNGPNQAHNVTLADPAPSGVTFLSITQQPSQGSCTLGASLLSCNFGTLGPGVQVTVRWNARVNVTGSIRNVGTATGQGTDTNGANNTDDAVTVVVAPLTPPPPAPKPKPKPQPKPAAEVCRTLSVGPKLLRATGRQQLVTIKVVEGKKPAKGVKVRITGPGITRTVTTNARGLVRVTLRPSRAGILRFTITNARACNTQRIGVVGVFEPPVTG